MIVVDYNLISAVHSSRDARLGRVEIANDGSLRGPRGNYNVRLYSRGDNPRLVRTARVENWPRNTCPAWRLIAAAFASLEAAGNKVDAAAEPCCTCGAEGSPGHSDGCPANIERTVQTA